MSRPIRVAHVTTVDLTLRFLLLDQLVRLREEGFEVTAISAPGPWTRRLEAEGIRHVPWRHATRAWSPVGDVRAFAELLAILRRERFDLVHTHNPKPGILGRLAARMVGVPVVVNTVHGLYATPEDPPAKRIAVTAVERFAARLSDLELYQSEEDLAWARRIGVVSRGKSVLLGNGTDVSSFDPSVVLPERLAELRRDLGIPEGSLVVGTVGRLVAEKGYRELFAAARRVRATVPEACFLVAGSMDADKRDAISPQEMARARGDVVFAGWREDVRDLMALMDVFVLPSWREGVPRSAIEAAAMARPLVLTDIRGCREVARDGIEGILVPPRDSARLAAAISTLLGDPQLRARLGGSARRRAVARFDGRRVLETVVSSYRELLSRKGLLPGQGRPVTFRRARRADAAAMAALHRRELPDSFLPTLGDPFLRRLYRAMVTDREAVALVAEDGRGVVGFVAGVLSVPAFYRRFTLRHGVAAAAAAAPRLLDAGVRRRLRETAGYAGGMNGGSGAELLSIAVAPGHRSQGVGRALAGQLLRRLADQGARQIRVVVGAGNAGANRFYEQLGFDRAGEVAVHRGVPSNVWVIRCRS